MSVDRRCVFVKAWIGTCNKTALLGSLYCAEHHLMKCCVTGTQATHECASTYQFVCGAPLADGVLDCQSGVPHRLDPNFGRAAEREQAGKKEKTVTEKPNETTRTILPTKILVTRRSVLTLTRSQLLDLLRRVAEIPDNANISMSAEAVSVSWEDTE